MNQKNKTSVLCYVAGKSAGHILPCVTRARELIKRYPNYEVLFFTSDGALDKKVIEQSQMTIQQIPLSIMNVPRARWYLLPLFFLQLFFAWCKAIVYLARCKPKQVVTTGGYIAIPVVLAARCLRVPVELQSLDAVPGKALQFLSPFAQAITVVFNSNTNFFPKHKLLRSSYPVRFNKEDRTISPAQARTELGLHPHRFTLFILGGSQGSLFLNELAKNHITALAKDVSIQIIHQTGSEDLQSLQTSYEALAIPHLLFSYSDKLARCYQAADVILCRAGAGTLFEILFFKKQCLVIPLESNTTHHQKNNARAMAQEYPQQYTVLDQKSVENNPDIVIQALRMQSKEITLSSHNHQESCSAALHR